jgi:hypothetical protein
VLRWKTYRRSPRKVLNSHVHFPSFVAVIDISLRAYSPHCSLDIRMVRPSDTIFDHL